MHLRTGNAFAGAVAVLLFAAAAWGQAYPSKPVRLIVPAAAGSPPDIQARWVADRLSAALGQTLVVDNRAGAGGSIGARAGASSPADGYTIMYLHQGVLLFNPHLYAKPGYDALRDFALIGRVATTPMAVTVRADDKVASIADLVRNAKEKPGQWTWGSAPIGAPPHLAGELFRRATGIDVILVPFKGSAVIEVVAGTVGYTLDIIGATLPQVRAGKLRALAVTSAARIPTLPDVPTLAASGWPDLLFDTWGSLCAPAGTPPAIVARINAELNAIMQSPAGRQWLATNGYDAVNDTPESFAALVRSEHEKWGVLIRKAGIRLE